MPQEKIVALSLGLMAAALLAQGARGEGAQPCAPREDVVATLHFTYGETRRASGLAANGALMELFASDDSGTWTLTATVAGGLTCLVASGGDYAVDGPAPAPAAGDVL